MKTLQAASIALLMLSTAYAKADLIGKVKDIDQSGVTLDIGQKLVWSPSITGPQRKGFADSYKPWTLVRLRTSSQGVVSIRNTDIQPDTMKVVSLETVRPFRGGFRFEKGHSFWGYIPKSVGVINAGDQSVYELNAQYDALRFSFLAMLDGDAVPVKLYWRVDGGEVNSHTSSARSLTALLIDVKGARSLQIWTENRTHVFGNDPDFIIDAELIQLTPAIPVLSSPASKESISAEEELRWRPVIDALGYRVELECIRLYSTDDAQKQRFFSIQTRADQRVVKLSDLSLPLGEYRWRVHSLDDVGVMGEMKEWWSFTLTK